jgi:2-methylcitrate dehydratase PrpD
VAGVVVLVLEMRVELAAAATTAATATNNATAAATDIAASDTTATAATAASTAAATNTAAAAATATAAATAAAAAPLSGWNLGPSQRFIPEVGMRDRRRGRHKRRRPCRNRVGLVDGWWNRMVPAGAVVDGVLAEKTLQA